MLGIGMANVTDEALLCRSRVQVDSSTKSGVVCM